MSSNLQERPHWMNGLEAMNAGRPLAELNQDPAPIIAELRTGKNVRQVAAELSISHQALYEWLLKYAPDDFMSLSAARQLVRLDETDDVFDRPQDEDTRKDGLAITRAREKARNAQWHLERANRKLFGQDKGLSISINNITSIERVILNEGQVGIGVTIDAPVTHSGEDEV